MEYLHRFKGHVFEVYNILSHEDYKKENLPVEVDFVAVWWPVPPASAGCAGYHTLCCPTRLWANLCQERGSA